HPGKSRLPQNPTRLRPKEIRPKLPPPMRPTMPGRLPPPTNARVVAHAVPGAIPCVTAGAVIVVVAEDATGVDVIASANLVLPTLLHRQARRNPAEPDRPTFPRMSRAPAV